MSPLQPLSLARGVLLAALALASGCYGSAELTQVGEERASTPPVVDPTPPLPGYEECAGHVPSPGVVTARRLNRAEYDNTVRDLLGDTTQPARDFPADDHGYGFDNNADVLSVSPLLMEKYEAVAERLVDEAWARDFLPGETTRVQAESASGTSGSAASGHWSLTSVGNVSKVVSFIRGGTWTLSARAWGSRGGIELPKMEFRIDGVTVATFDVDALSGAPKTYSKQVEVTEGNHVFAVAFINDFYDPNNPDPSLRDRNLYVDWFETSIPTHWMGTASRLRTCDPASSDPQTCAAQILGDFASRAWRRPVEPAELTRLLGFLAIAAEHGDGFDVGVKLALKAVLLSPHFLFRLELDPAPTLATPRRLTGYELASRLSYFLWSSTPDDVLLEAAAKGELETPAQLEAQVLRMLADPRADALVDNFAGQWLETRAVGGVEVEASLFPDFDPALQAAMQTETERFVSAFLKENRPVRDMFDADFTFLNDRLATHYGLPLPGSDALTRVTLPASSHRGGLLTQGAFLTLTSHPDRTSPVKRGKWVLSQLLCSEPPPPPPGVENLVETGELTGTLRERFEQHRADPVCAGCHTLMDPIGFGLENFDAVGAWRETEESGAAIDSSGQLPTGERFTGAGELSAILKADPNLAACVSKHLFVFALGRGDRPEDRCTLASLGAEAERRGGGLVDYIQVLVQSEPFTRRGDLIGGTP